MGRLLQTLIESGHKLKQPLMESQSLDLNNLRQGTGCLKELLTMFIGKSGFYERYTTGCLLGKGGNGQVYAGYRNSDHFPVAIKVVDKKRLVEGSINNKNVRVPIEVALLHKSRHVKGVIKLMEYTELPDCFVIIMERKVKSIKDDCKDLYDFITDQHRANGCVSEELAKKIFKQVVQTVIDLEKLNVLHGDIKDENILIDTQTNEIKLIDFGAGNKLFEEKSYHTYHGTRVYAPPEWIKHKSYTASGLNVWSLGVLLYDLLTGDIPFKNDNATLSAKLSFPNHAIISDGAKDLIRSCLNLSVQSRIILTQNIKVLKPYLLIVITNTKKTQSLCHNNNLNILVKVKPQVLPNLSMAPAVLPHLSYLNLKLKLW